MDKQLCLGHLIDRLEKLDPDLVLTFDFAELEPQHFESYRGNYAELAVCPKARKSNLPETVGRFLTRCKEASITTFTGYKGGEFDMGLGTPVWVANYGETSFTYIVGVVANYYMAILVTKSELPDGIDLAEVH